MKYEIEESDLLSLLKDLGWVRMPSSAVTDAESRTRWEGPNSTFVYLKHETGPGGENPKLLNCEEALVTVARAVNVSVPELVATALMHHIRRCMVVTIHPLGDGFQAGTGAYCMPYAYTNGVRAPEHSSPGEALAKLGEKIDKDLCRLGFEQLTQREGSAT